MSQQDIQQEGKWLNKVTHEQFEQILKIWEVPAMGSLFNWLTIIIKLIFSIKMIYTNQKIATTGLP